MSEDNHTNIQSLSTDALLQLDRRGHALDGTLFLTKDSNYGLGAGIAPHGNYAGFICGDTVPTITSAEFLTDKHTFASGESLATVVLTGGAYYPYDGLHTITITAGSIILIKQNTY
jgi:hypothetical protein